MDLQKPVSFKLVLTYCKRFPLQVRNCHRVSHTILATIDWILARKSLGGSTEMKQQCL